MLSSSSEIRPLTLAAFDAMQKGDAQRARELFDSIVASGRADASILLGLAFACRQLGDKASAIAAIDKVLALDQTNLQALILKGDHLLEAGDNRAAVAFYASAIRRVSPRDKLPPAFQNDLRRAQQACETYAKQYEAHLRTELAARGFDEHSTGRFAQSLDLMTGKKRIYYQQPQHYYFPELPQIQFYERAMFPWLDTVEAATEDIRAELLGVLQQPNAFTPYVESHQNRPNIDATGTIDNPDWSAFFLWKNGEIVPENAARCPRTLDALKDVPFCRIAGRSPSILFSLLRPGAKIPPHTGMINTRLICHLPLIVPGQCRFRVGNDTRDWVEGKAWLFDDTIEHEAWNGSDKLRVVLIFDVWRPELTEEERRLVAAMIEAVDAFGGPRQQWQA